MSENRQRLKVDVEDLIRLAVEFSPAEAKQKIEELYNRVDAVAKGLDTVFNSPTLHGLEGFLSKMDGVISFLNTMTGGSLGNVLQGIAVFRNITSILESGKLSATSLIATITSFLPAGVKEALGEAGKVFNTVMGVVQFLKNLDPRKVALGFVGGLIAGAINRVLPAPIANFLGNILGGTPLGQILNLGGGGSIIDRVLGSIFGSAPATASVKVMDSLPGGFEAPDGIILSEKHIRIKITLKKGEKK